MLTYRNSVPTWESDSGVQKTGDTMTGTLTINATGANLNVIQGIATIGTVTQAANAALTVTGNANLTGAVTAAAFYGTFEGTYTGVDIKAAGFMFPFAGGNVDMMLPFNANITSLEVEFDGGTNVTGTVTAAAGAWSGAASTSGSWLVMSGTALPFAYNAFTTISFNTPVVTGAVSNETICVFYKRRP